MASGKFAALYDEEETPVAAPRPPVAVVDAGPEARRAASGMPKAGGTVDPEPSGPEYGRLPTGLVPGRLPTRPPTPEGQASGVPDPMTRPRPADVMEVDPLAQGVVAGTVLGPVGQAVTPAVASAIGPAPAAVAVGATEGAIASKAVGGDASTGAKIGAILPAARILLGGVGAAEFKAMNARADNRLFRDVGKMGTQPQRAELERLGAKRTAEVARELDLPNAPDKRVPVQGALRETGQRIGDAYQALDMAGHGRPLGNIMSSLEELRGQLGRTTEGEKLANVVFDKMERIWKLHGGDKSAVVPMSLLNREIGDLEKIGFSGKTAQGLSETGRAVVSRQLANTLNKELDAGLSVARKDPALAVHVKSIEELNPRFEALKVLEKVTNRFEAQQPFAPGFAERAAGAPVRTTARAARSVIGAVPRAGDAISRPFTGVPGLRAAGEAAEGAALPAAIGDALHRRDPDAIAVGLARELFAR